MCNFALKKLLGVWGLCLVLIFSFDSGPAYSDNGGQPAAKRYSEAKECYYNLMGSPTKRALRSYWMVCAGKFVSVYKNYPKHHLAPKAVFTLGRLYHNLFEVTKNHRDLDLARNFYKKVSREFKDDRLADDALFYQGEIHLARKNFSPARLAFEQILKTYSEGDQTNRARKRLKESFPVSPVRTAAIKVPVNSEAPIRLTKVSYTVSPRSVRVVMHTNGPVRVSQKRLTNPDRFYLNLLNVRLDDEVKREIKVEGGILNKIRLSQFSDKTGRVVLDVPSDKDLKIVTSLEKSGVIIDLLEKVNSSPVLPRSKPVAVKTSIPKPPVVRNAQVKKQAPVIVIDPGHGGKDFGARSPGGLMEKHVNLDVSQSLKWILENRYHYRVVMTRKDDSFIALETRGEIANRKKADLFVSIHANAAKRRSARGIETYYLGVAHSEQAQETAARENGKLVHSVPDGQVQQILANMISTAKMNDSSWLAAQVQENLARSMKKKFRRVKDLGVKEGPFFVLHDTNMPSILIEVGFMTNSREERRLRNSNYLRNLASSIALGIHKFLQNRPSI